MTEGQVHGTQKVNSKFFSGMTLKLARQKLKVKKEVE